MPMSEKEEVNMEFGDVLQKQFMSPVVEVFKELKDGSEKKFVKVIITGVREDRDGERLSDKACLGVIDKLKSGKVPVFSNHGLDDAGGKTYRWEDIMGKWVDGTWHENKTDVVATMMINEANPKAEQLWKYCEAGMPIGFSIGGKVNKQHEEDVEL
jgi:hypothetical protein